MMARSRSRSDAEWVCQRIEARCSGVGVGSVSLPPCTTSRIYLWPPLFILRDPEHRIGS
ncbi:hypothetical protein BGW80DRAFT_1303029 [Lactifluus volemus]|nr:hypothetical protein BGW80DRAFT_1303029 [Lactifluus volemus]